MDDWHLLDIEDVVMRLETDREHGLTHEQWTRRQSEHGINELVERGVKSPWLILLDQLKETMVLILILAAIISALMGDMKDALAILAIVVINTLLGFRQEYQAEKAMAALKKLAVPTVKVRRDGHVAEISARDLVPGDVVLLEAGNLIPADGRLIESVNLRVQEAALTGESEPVSKHTEALANPKLPLAERQNMVYMGTVVTYGRGTAVITKTGMQTELGGIAEMMQAAGQEPTPLQVRLGQLGKALALVAFVLVAIVFALGWWRGEELRLLFLTSIGMAVAAVPEGLPAVVTIALALGARRMLKLNALIRKLPAVETLGSVTVICSDKTGTLTENRMTVTILDVAEHRIDLTEEGDRQALYYLAAPCGEIQEEPGQATSLADYPALALLMAGGALCNDAILECDEDQPNQFHIVGDPTEGALVVAAARMGMTKEHLENALPRVAEVPFDSERKRMTTVHQMGETMIDIPPVLKTVLDKDSNLRARVWQPGGRLVFTKGAVDSLLEVSHHVWVEDQVKHLNEHWRSRILEANAQLAKKGMRVLGVAFRRLGPDEALLDDREHEAELVFIGLTGMIDPARPEVQEAVATCRSAGIRPVMITGDHPLTARYIAIELGIDGREEVLTGHDLDRMTPEELAETVARVSVYARVSPEHKLKIVQALQSRGQIAAMTGDGVNDAPALKKADIGVAMGITGTDVSKEAADMVLLDDNFATIVAAVKEGRVIYDNIRKFIKYTMTSNAGEIWVMLLAPFLGMPLALLPLQILWINLVTDGIPGLALGVENPERDTMRRPPYPPNENIFARGVGRDILVIGFLMGLISLLIGYWYWSGNPVGPWQTMIFTTLTLSEMGYVMAIRSNRDSLFSIGLTSNRPMIWAVGFTTLLQIAVLYIPFMQDLLGIRPLGLSDLAICLGLGTSLFWVVEFLKWLRRRRIS